MLSAALAGALVGAPGVGPVFDRASTVHRNMNAAGMEIRVVQTSSGIASATEYRVDYERPNRLRLRASLPARGALAPTTRTFWVSGNRVIGYDSATNELVRRSAEAATAGQRLASTFSELEPAVVAVVYADGMANFLRPLRQLKGWNVVVRGNETIAFRQGSGTSARLAFDRTRGRLLSVRLSAPAGRSEWTVRYTGAPKGLAPAPPSDARPVPQFTNRRLPPRFRDTASRQAIERAARAFDIRREFDAIVSEGGTQSRWRLSRTGVREKQGSIEWAWSQGNLWVRDRRKNTLWRGKAARVEAFDALKALKVGMDPTLGYLLRGQNPVREMLEPVYSVRAVGSMVLDGVDCDLVLIEGPRVRTNLVIRRADGLVATTSNEVRDASGEVVSRSERRFRWNAVASAAPAGSFALAPERGERVRPMSELLRR